MFDAQKYLSKLPDNPGVYLFYNLEKELIYVGKATSLKSRVSSYWRGPRSTRPIEQLMHEVVDIKWQETDSVLEAVILEANLIHEKQPKYNVDGKDDKSWNYICITRDEYPRVVTVRQHELTLPKHLSTLAPERFYSMFGPYPGLNTKATMKILRGMFQFSTCTPGQKRPCLYYQMGQCLGVCTGEISPKEYRAKVIRPLVTFLSGRKKQLLKSLEVAMRKAAKAENFEEAARLRNQISSLQRIQDIALLNKSFVSDPAIQSEAKQSSESLGINRIEGYDISNLGTTGKVGSQVVFEHGEPNKNQYRKYKIKTVEGQSDVDCLEEVLRRRLRHTEWPYPQLFLIDGGKPQVNRAMSVFKDLGISIPLIGIAKGAERKRNDIIIGSADRETIRWVYAHTRLLINVRDEAHRCAITCQRKLREI